VRSVERTILSEGFPLNRVQYVNFGTKISTSEMSNYFILLSYLCCVLIPNKAVTFQIGTQGTAPLLGYKVINTYPHDIHAFTEGLFFYDDFMYESTGLYGGSSLRKVNVTTGTPVKQISINKTYFAEGCTIFDNQIFQLTWREDVVFQYNWETFAVTETFTNPETEGWGLTQNGTHLIMSTGSSYLYFLDPYDFEVLGNVSVVNGNRGVSNLNELEYINGEVWANVWMTNKIVKINPWTGLVTGIIDFTNIKPRRGQEFNGIAYDSVNNRTFVTGKNWPSLFEVEVFLQ